MANYKAFQNTTVPISKSLGEISGLAISHGGGYGQFQVQDGFAVEISFRTESGKSNVYRFQQVITPDFLIEYRQDHPKHRKESEELKKEELARRARALFWYLKGMFEIVDLGYANLGQLLIGQLKLPRGNETLYDVYGQAVEAGELGLPVKATPLSLSAKVVEEPVDAEYEEVKE